MGPNFLLSLRTRRLRATHFYPNRMHWMFCTGLGLYLWLCYTVCWNRISPSSRTLRPTCLAGCSDLSSLHQDLGCSFFEILGEFCFDVWKLGRSDIFPARLTATWEKSIRPHCNPFFQKSRSPRPWSCWGQWHEEIVKTLQNLNHCPLQTLDYSIISSSQCFQS